MPIIAHINYATSIRVHRILGRVTAAEFLESVDYYRAHPHLGRTDLINLVDETVDVSAFAMKDLELLRGAFREFYEELRLEVVLRSAWVCPNVRAWPLVEEWLRDRHSRDCMATEVLLVSRLEDAKSLFDSDELALVRDWIGFSELKRFEAPEPSARY